MKKAVTCLPKRFKTTVAINGALLAVLCLHTPPTLAQDVTKTIPTSQGQVIFSYAPLVKKAAPAVVNIYSRKKIKVQSFSPFANDPLFQQFFDLPSGIMRERVESSLGSGVIIKPDGLIMTNNHVVTGSDDVKVALADRREFEAKIVLQDEKTDLALLRIDAGKEPLPYLQLGDSDHLEVGDMVLAIGNPYGVGQTVTSGIVSALARTTAGVTDYQFFIQTDAAINPGNSGGALIDMQGNVIGINTAIFSKTGGYQGIGFATPSNMAATVINGMNNKGQVIRPWLGVTMQRITPDIAASLNLKAPVGALISKVYADSPAEKAGLKVGDLVIAVDSHEVEDEQALRFRVATYPIGKKVPFTVMRGDQNITVNVMMAPPSENPPRDERLLTGAHLLEGAVVANLSPALADELGLNIQQEGVVIMRTSSGATAASLGFRPQDIIEEVNSTSIKSTAQLEKLLHTTASDPKIQGWKVVIWRDGRQISVIVSK